ncbi:dTDP-4-dehydrorhamnose 3,5-epimerase family protein, partial [Flavobacterium succinicans]
MNLEATFIKDLVVLTPDVFEDSRGYFFEGYNKNKMNTLGITIDFVQDNQSFSQKGTLRGLHYQNPPFAQTKLVRVLHGEIMDVA